MHTIPTSPGVAPSPSILCRKASARSKRLYSDLAAGVTSAMVSLSASPRCPTVPPTDWAVETQTERAAYWQTRSAVSGTKVAVGGRGQRLRVRTRVGEPARAVWATAAAQPEEDRLIRNVSGLRTAFPQGSMVR